MIHENLYSATYSGVAVYEFIHPKSSVMRRKKDGWVNATHILKVANFPKAKRTRILEKDVQTGVHEKVQGGYGKYQGTWVPLKRAIEIAQQFGVLNDLNPVFDYVSNGSITPPPAPKHHHATTASGTRKQRNSNATGKATKAANKTSKVTAKLKDAKSTPGPKPKRQKTQPNILPQMHTTPKLPYMQNDNELTSPTLNIQNQNQSGIPMGFNNTTPTSASRNSLLTNNNNNNSNSNNNVNYNNNGSLNSDYKSKRILKAPKGVASSFQTAPLGSFPNLDDDLDDDIDDDDDDEDDDMVNLQNKNNINDHRMIPSESFYRRLHEPSTIEFMSEHDLDKALAESQTYGEVKKSTSFSNQSLNNNNNHINNNNNNPTGLHNIPTSAQSNRSEAAIYALDKSYVKTLYNYFIETDSNPNAEMPYFITHPVENFNINQPIDNQGNALLHWACSMGDVKMCEILINRSCDVHVLNNKGEEPIVRSVIYANCYAKRTFGKLLDLLSNCLLDVDINGRTLLHHIALATSDKNNLPSSRYYAEILLRKIAETVQSNETFKEFIDKKDIDGNTALHIMSFNNSKKCIKILLGYNARVDIRNNRNDQVGDYLTQNFKNPTLINGLDSHVGELHNDDQPYESFNLRPFNPSMNKYMNGYPISRNNSHRIAQSYMEPFQSPSLHQNLLLNMNQPSIVGSNSPTNHVSTTSMKINQLSAELFEKMNELSNAFDNEVSQKNDDIKELNSIVKQMDDDLNKTTNEIKTLMNVILGSGSETFEDKELGDYIRKIETQSRDLSNEYLEKKNMLKRLIDRSQAMGLAKIVQQYEYESLSQLDNSGDSSTALDPILSKETVNQLLDLALLQIIRKKSVNFLVKIQARSETNIDTINSYRRLVSKLSNMPIDEVDSSLNSIEECLRKDNEQLRQVQSDHSTLTGGSG